MWQKMWRGREFESATFHTIGGIGIGLLISAWFGTFLGLAIIFILISLAGHWWAFNKTKEVR